MAWSVKIVGKILFKYSLESWVLSLTPSIVHSMVLFQHGALLWVYGKVAENNCYNRNPLIPIRNLKARKYHSLIGRRVDIGLYWTLIGGQGTGHVVAMLLARHGMDGTLLSPLTAWIAS